jgi:hypothetical protein
MVRVYHISNTDHIIMIQSSNMTCQMTLIVFGLATSFNLASWAVSPTVPKVFHSLEPSSVIGDPVSGKDFRNCLQ